MPRALVTVNGSTLGVVNAPINTLVQLDNDGIGGELTYLWAITDQPPGTPDTLSNVAAQAPTFTPRKEGSYLLLLIVNAGLPDERRDTNVVGVRQLKTLTRIPAAGEGSEAGAVRGHAQDANEILQLLDTMRADPLLMVAQANGALTRNNVVRFSGMATIKSGLPGQEDIPVVSIAPASATNVLTEQLAVVEGSVNRSSDSVSSGQLVLVRLGGVQQASGITGSAGNAVYVSNAGVLTLTAGTNFRRVGTLISSDDVLMDFGNSAGSTALSSATPSPVAAAGAAGSGLTASRADHVHAHGDQLGGSLHELVTVAIAGFMSPEDKAKLDGISPGATPVGVGNSTPMPVAAVGAPGDSLSASRENHVHAHGNQAGGTTHELVTVTIAGFMSAPDKVKLDGINPGATNTPLATSTPAPVGPTGGVGGASSAARADHVHAHGDQAGGTQHTVVTTAIAGFMSPADKIKLDGIDPEVSGALGLSSATPSAVGTASAVGVDTGAARGDHVHAHGNQPGGGLHAAATTLAAGFMSIADKIKLDGISPGANTVTFSTTAPLPLGIAAAGTATTAARGDHVHPHNLATTNPNPLGVTAVGTAVTAARADHVHPHGDVVGGSTHSLAVANGAAGFLSGVDKFVIDFIQGDYNRPFHADLSIGRPVTSADQLYNAWTFNGFKWITDGASAPIRSISFSLNHILQQNHIFTQVEFLIQPSVGRSGTGRMAVAVGRANEFGVVTNMISEDTGTALVYDNSSSGQQIVTFNFPNVLIDKTQQQWVAIVFGGTGPAAANDQIQGIRVRQNGRLVNI